MKPKFLSTLITLVFLAGAFMLFGQDVTIDTTAGVPVGEDTFESPANFAAGVEWVYGFLIILLGYLSPYIPVLNKINSGIYRVLAVAVVIGAAFFFGAGASVWTLLITYTMSTSFYEVILKLIQEYFKPKPEAEPVS